MTEWVTIRRITDRDVAAVVAMSLTFLASDDYRTAIVPDPERLRALVLSWLEGGDKACWIAESSGKPIGLIAMIAFVHPMSGEPVASEVVWWIDPDARGAGMKLLRVAETWAKEKGATRLIMIAPNPRVGTFYDRLGFSLVEMTYQRSVA